VVVVQVAAVLAAALLVSSCAREDPARSALRARLEQQEKLSTEEIGRVLDEVGRSLEGRTIRIVDGPSTSDLDEAQREVVLGMLTERAGIFDEGLQSAGGSALRVLNAPGRSENPEIEASRRLFIDVRTFLPRHFEFKYAFPSPDDYAFELVVD
jgi:hypothetical protein